MACDRMVLGAKAGQAQGHQALGTGLGTGTKCGPAVWLNGCHRARGRDKNCHKKGLGYETGTPSSVDPLPLTLGREQGTG